MLTLRSSDTKPKGPLHINGTRKTQIQKENYLDFDYCRNKTFATEIVEGNLAIRSRCFAVQL